MPLHLWEAIHDADVRSDPVFVVDPSLAGATPPSLQRVLLAAATLWCRTLTWPTVREISTTAGVAASTSISVVGSSDRLRELVIASERCTIDDLCGRRLEECPDDAALPWAIRTRVRRLAGIDPALALLPLMVGVIDGDRRTAVIAASAWLGDILDALARNVVAA